MDLPEDRGTDCILGFLYEKKDLRVLVTINTNMKEFLFNKNFIINLLVSNLPLRSRYDAFIKYILNTSNFRN